MQIKAMITTTPVRPIAKVGTGNLSFAFFASKIVSSVLIMVNNTPMPANISPI